MTNPTVPPEPCPIEFDPMAAPCGTGLEGWGEITDPLAICDDGVTVFTTDWWDYQEAVIQGRVGACPAAPAEPAAVVLTPTELPVTGAEHVVMGGIASVLLAAGVVFVRLSRRSV